MVYLIRIPTGGTYAYRFCLVWDVYLGKLAIRAWQRKG